MIDQHTLFEIHRMHAEGLSQRKIALQLNLSRATVKRHLCHPQIVRKKIQKPSKLDPFKVHMEQWLQSDASLSATVVLRNSARPWIRGEIRDCEGLSQKDSPQTRCDAHQTL